MDSLSDRRKVEHVEEYRSAYSVSYKVPVSCHTYVKFLFSKLGEIQLAFLLMEFIGC